MSFGLFAQNFVIMRKCNDLKVFVYFFEFPKPKPHIIIMKKTKESSLEPQCDKFDKFHKSMKPSNGRTSISETIQKCIRVSIKDFFLKEAKTVYVYSSPAPIEDT